MEKVFDYIVYILEAALSVDGVDGGEAGRCDGWGYIQRKNLRGMGKCRCNENYHCLITSHTTLKSKCAALRKSVGDCIWKQVPLQCFPFITLCDVCKYHLLKVFISFLRNDTGLITCKRNSCKI